MSWYLTRREIPLTLTLIVGLFLLINYFVTIPALRGSVDVVTKSGSVLIAVATSLGAVSLIFIHGRHVKKKTPGQWPFSAWLIGLMIVMIIAGLIQPTATHPIWNFLFVNVYQPISATAYSLVGFFIVSSAFKSFRARTLDATLILIFAVLVMLGNVPAFTYYLPPLEMVRTWIMEVPNDAGWRAFMIGAGVGAIMLGFRIIIGRERGYLGAT